MENKELLEAILNNTEQILALLKINNKHTIDLHKTVEAELTTESQLKQFGYNILANIAGNSITTPTILNLK